MRMYTNNLGIHFMAQITWLIDGSNINHDYQVTALANALTNPGVISWLLVSTNSVALWEAFILCTRTNWQIIEIHYQNTAAVTIDTSGTKKVWIGVDQSVIDNGSSNATDWTGIATIRTGASYPAGNYIPLASITGGVITDARTFISGKALLANWYWINKVKEIDPTTWNEALRDISSWSSILSTELIQIIDPTTRTRKEVPYSFIENTITQWDSQDNISGEALTINDAVTYEYVQNSIWVVASWMGKYLQMKMWDVSGNTKKSMKIIGNAVSASTLKLWLGKVAWPTDNIQIRIETDSAWKPSGTLAHANATANIAGTGLTTTVVDTTVTFTWAFTLTANTLYHVVIQRQNAVDPVNYYVIGAVTKNVRMLKVNSHNGTAWQTESAVQSIYMVYAWAYSRYIVKSISSMIELNWVDGIVIATVALWAVCKINREWLMSWFSGLTDWATYYLSSTAWLLTSTWSATAREVGYAVWTTKLYIKNSIYNPNNYEYSLENANYYLNEWAVQFTNLSTTFRSTSRSRLGTGMTFSGGNGTLNVYVNNTTARTIASSSIPLSFIDIYPGDLVTINWIAWTWNYGRVLAFQMLLPPVWHFE